MLLKLQCHLFRNHQQFHFKFWPGYHMIHFSLPNIWNRNKSILKIFETKFFKHETRSSVHILTSLSWPIAFHVCISMILPVVCKFFIFSSLKLLDKDKIKFMLYNIYFVLIMTTHTWTYIIVENKKLKRGKFLLLSI